MGKSIQNSLKINSIPDSLALAFTKSSKHLYIYIGYPQDHKYPDLGSYKMVFVLWQIGKPLKTYNFTHDLKVKQT